MQFRAPCEARALLARIPVTRTVRLRNGSTQETLGLRDRAPISVMTYAFGGIGAMLGMHADGCLETQGGTQSRSKNAHGKAAVRSFGL